MDPITLIVAALAAGAATAAATAGQETAQQAVEDAYSGLKALVVRKFAGKGEVPAAVAALEARPDSANRRGVLQEELTSAGAGADAEVQQQAQALLDLLKALPRQGDAYTATLTGSGAIAQGPGAVAAGQGGVAVGGNVYGGIAMRGAAPGRSAAEAGGGLPPEAAAAALRTQLDARKHLLLALETQRVLASGAEAARLDVQMAQERAEIRGLEERLVALGR